MPSAIEQILSLKSKQLLYVSCNPKTQVENIIALEKGGYRVEKIQPVDQFPQTQHLENIVLMNFIHPQ